MAKSEYARVFADAESQDLAAQVAALMDESAPRIAALVGATDLRPIPALVYEKRSAFLSAAGLSPRSPVVGLASFPANIIHIDGTGLLASLARVVPHEVAHVMIARAMGPALELLPRWANEGMAEYAAGPNASQVDPESLRAIGRGKALPLAKLDQSLEGDDTSRSLAYAQSASVVNFLVARHGPEVISALLRATREYRDFDLALRRVTGWNLEQLEAAWRRSLASRWRWPLLFQSQALILAVMLAVFIFAYLRYRRERRRRQEMPDSDW